MTLTEHPKLRLSPPWWIYFNKVQALFSLDPEVTIRLMTKTPDGNWELPIFVANETKAEAIRALLPAVVEAGDMIFSYVFGPESNEALKRMAEPPAEILELIQNAFDGNPLFNFVASTQKGSFDCKYAVFAKKVVQFYADDLSSFYTTMSTLPEFLVKELLETDDVGICTDIENDEEIVLY